MERKGYKHTDDDESYEKASEDKDYDGDHDAESKSVTSSGQDDELDALDKMDDLEVEQEWNAIRHLPSGGRIQKATDPRGKCIAEGLKINFMNMRCSDTGRLLWQSQKWGHDMFEREQKAVVPKSILDCGSVSREINFSSLHEITDFRLEQRVFLHGKCLEEWLFTFGYVIPDSTNSWQQMIEAAETMLPADAISGKITIETGFYDGDALIAKTVYRIFYE
ncbi:unnamed protein product [Aphanomyces euteiches]